jgi:hypothetical protein
MASPLAARRGKLSLRTAHVYFDLSSAIVARCKLQAYGIPAFIDGESHANINPAIIFALGGLRLRVPEMCLEDTRDILKQDPCEAEEICPVCNSEKVWRKKRMAVFLLISILSACAFPFVPASNVRLCRSCKHEWRHTDVD